MLAGQKWCVAAGLHIAGAMTGGGLAAAVIWLAATPLRGVPTELTSALLVATLLLAGVNDFIWRLPFPQRRVQVDPAALVRYPVGSALIYGLILGTGVLTFITFASLIPYLLVVGLQPSPGPALLLGTAHGIGRGSLPFVIARLAPTGAETPAAVEQLTRLRETAAVWSWLAAAVLVADTLAAGDPALNGTLVPTWR